MVQGHKVLAFWVGLSLELRTEQPGFDSRKESDCYLLHKAHTRSGAHRVSCSVATEGFVPSGKEALS
jgi:hypothetical protein